MGNPRLLALLAVAGGIVAFGVYGMFLAPQEPPVPPKPRPAPSRVLTLLAPSPTPTPTPSGPEVTAAAYFDAWRGGDLDAMADLVADPPADFADRHRRFDAELRVASLEIVPDELAYVGEDRAEVPFDGVREVDGLGAWEFDSVLRLERRPEGWKVRWEPETLHPALREGGSLQIRETPVERPSTLTSEGLPFPHDSHAEAHFAGLSETAMDLSLEEAPSGRVLLAARAPDPETRRTTISAPVQAAAARALDGVGPAAIVAVDIATREVRAVADTLGGKGAVTGLYPAGSTFKVVTAAALLGHGLGPDTPVPCPAAYTVANGRTFTNAGGRDHGTVPFGRAFALSCNTTFAQQAVERLGEDRLRAEAADRFGFREKPGMSACRIGPPANPDELGSDAIGQNSVLASPLCMAEVAAAVAGGVWRPAVMTPERPADLPPDVPLDAGTAAALRAMMSAVVTEGTAAGAGLPPGTHGKTGTAEVGESPPHAWFIGYRGPLAFAVFVQHGGSGPGTAAPLAARFLNAL